jgi:general stress protein 26
MTSKDPQTNEQETEQFEQLIERFDEAMLVSIANDGTLHARPMAIAGHAGGVLRFATSRRSAKTAEIFYQPRVAVVAQGGGAFLAISGTASISDEVGRIREHWRPSWKLWFEGPEDPRLVLIEVDPEHAEYWDRSGVRRLEFLWEAGKALATGRRVEDSRLSGHHKFSFG